jgi:hypothetical protein
VALVAAVPCRDRGNTLLTCIVFGRLSGMTGVLVWVLDQWWDIARVVQRGLTGVGTGRVLVCEARPMVRRLLSLLAFMARLRASAVSWL